MLPSVAAAVIGGTSIFGGRGGYAGTILGALILTVLATLLTVLQMPEGARRILFGAHHPAGHRRLSPHRRGPLTRQPSQYRGPGPALPARSAGFASRQRPIDRQPQPMHSVRPSRSR